MCRLPTSRQRLRTCGAISSVELKCGVSSLSIPAPYPVKHSIVANKVAILGLQEGWGMEFIRGAYRRWFQLGQGEWRRAQP